VNIKFSALLNKSPSQILRILEEAYGKGKMKKSLVYGHNKRFPDDCVNNNPHCRQQSTSTDDQNV
jgi:hypothetical protein